MKYRVDCYRTLLQKGSIAVEARDLMEALDKVKDRFYDRLFWDMYGSENLTPLEAKINEVKRAK